MAIGLLLLLGACGKSAQFPLQSWLLDAMEGPTPVSALIHAATMVTAGVYLIVRSAAIFNGNEIAQTAVVIVGTITLLMGAIIGCAKDDIKKALAGSTMSQIGYMMLAAGLGPAGYAFAIFHLLTHGFFKADLFLGAGSVMHGMNDEVDMRRYGALRVAMPITFLTFAAGYLAIIGIPPFAGFFSKDSIIEVAIASNFVAGFCALVGAGITAFYMTRVMLMTFVGEKRWAAEAHPHESPLVMTIPLMILGGLSVVGGAALLYIGGGIVEWLEPVTGEEHVELGIPIWAMTLITLAVVLVGVFIAWQIFGRQAGARNAAARFSRHRRGPARPLRRRRQRGRVHAARAVPDQVARLCRQSWRRRRRRRHSSRGRRFLLPPAPMADRVRPLVCPVHARRRSDRRRGHAGGEAAVNFPWLTTLIAVPLLGAALTALVPRGLELAAKRLALFIAVGYGDPRADRRDRVRPPMASPSSSSSSTSGSGRWASSMPWARPASPCLSSS